MPVIVMLTLPLVGCFVAGVLVRLITTSEPSPAVVLHTAWSDNVIPFDRERRRERGKQMD